MYIRLGAIEVGLGGIRTLEILSIAPSPVFNHILVYQLYQVCSVADTILAWNEFDYRLDVVHVGTIN